MDMGGKGERQDEVTCQIFEVHLISARTACLGADGLENILSSMEVTGRSKRPCIRAGKEMIPRREIIYTRGLGMEGILGQGPIDTMYTAV